MYLYNVTVNIEAEVEKEWLHWIKEKHIPDVLATGMFAENRIFRLLNEPENNGITYSIQYFSHSLEKINYYLDHYAKALAAEHFEKFKHKHVAFRTILLEV